ncbi:calcium/proton exchanger [uncultured Clostridium sp.]|jgi:Ca2+:H+ antiporter|uniref:calcium/proton exchanger n=1 Tax=uncultured Clostridium sp. TaxID=59620 RepID=UPI002630C9FD|nr:calcium/proton exchanger [uncultured Clostridium sp.]
MKYLKVLLIFVPISIIGMFLKWSPTLLFVVSALAIIPLAGMIGEATEELTFYTGAKLGGFLNATFGNATELIITFLAIKEGLFELVKASIAGSIIGNSLFVLGASMLAGGLKFKIQKFNRRTTDTTASMLLFAVIGLCIPAIFMHTVKPAESAGYEYLSIIVAVVMFIIYILSLIFSFFTHKEVFAVIHEDVEDADEDAEPETAKWSLARCLITLVGVTIFVALMSEILVSAVEPMTKTIGLSEFFVGIIIVPIVGNAAEHSTAVVMALKNKMDVAVEIALGSSLQIILLVLPLALFFSLFFTPMSIIFNPFELVALLASVVIANKVASDGESNWLEGTLLIGIYIILALGFFILK